MSASNVGRTGRARLFETFGGRCAYCLVADADHLDHVVPRSAGGSNGTLNQLPACTPCGTSKGNLSVADWVRALAAGQTAPSHGHIPPDYGFWEVSPRRPARAAVA